ncbi:MAG: cytochrome c maturation protein CcmE [Acidimicrobiia bacterium]|nr:cytochrome c maturation protein CcmE [Acidimicrobiia bacterium]
MSGPERPGDAPAVDLTPLAAEPGPVAAVGAPATGRGASSGVRRRRWRNLAMIAVVLVALGAVLVRGLGDATLFFYNVDEAVAQRGELGQRRFNIQGTAIPATIERTSEGATFEIQYDGVVAAVVHRGDLPQLFQADIPLVLEGHWDGDRFSSDRMIVKHSEVYRAENPDRVDAYDEPRP